MELRKKQFPLEKQVMAMHKGSKARKAGHSREGGNLRSKNGTNVFVSYKNTYNRPSSRSEIPAFAGMTYLGRLNHLLTHFSTQSISDRKTGRMDVFASNNINTIVPTIDRSFPPSRE
jgi:hypothetical protein